MLLLLCSPFQGGQRFGGSQRRHNDRIGCDHDPAATYNPWCSNNYAQPNDNVETPYSAGANEANCDKNDYFGNDSASR